jgi:DNA-binding NarL/FixJ family response regulator
MKRRTVGSSAREPDGAPISVIVVCPVHLFREGLARLLDKDARLRVLGTFEDTRAAIAQGGELGADCVLLDMASPGSAKAALALRLAWPSAKIVAIGMSERDIVSGAESGISGFVLRDGSTENLVQAVQGAMAEELVCSRRTAARLFRRVGRLAARARAHPEVRLTPREAQIVALIDRGLTNKEIATRLVVEVSTVKNHVHNLLEKLGVRTRGEAAARVRSWHARDGGVDPFAADPHLKI